MNTKVQVLDDKILVSLSGEFDTAAAEEMEKSLQPLLDCGAKDIFIDCTELDYISSRGLRILLVFLKNAKANGSRLVLQNVNDEVRDVLELTGFVTIFEIE